MDDRGQSCQAVMELERVFELGIETVRADGGQKCHIRVWGEIKQTGLLDLATRLESPSNQQGEVVHKPSPL